MPLYRVETRETTGHSETRLIAAENQEAAVRLARARGRFIITVERLRARREGGAIPAVRDALWPVCPRDHALFFLHLSEMVGAGHSVGHALGRIGPRMREARLARFCEEVADEVSAGMPLSEAVALYPGSFPPWVAPFIAAAEHAGALDTMLSLLEEEFRDETQFWRRFTVASIYTRAILVFALIAATSPSAIGLGVGGWLTSLGILLAFGAAGWYVARAIGRLPFLRSAREHLGRLLPVYGGLQRNRAALRVARAVKELMGAGVAPDMSFEVAAPVSGSAWLSRRVQRGADALRAGAGLGQAFAAAGIFGKRITGLMMTAEETGRLDEMLEEAVASFARWKDRDALRAAYSGWGCLIIIGALVTVLGFYLGASGYVSELLHQADKLME